MILCFLACIVHFEHLGFYAAFLSTYFAFDHITLINATEKLHTSFSSPFPVPKKYSGSNGPCLRCSTRYFRPRNGRFMRPLKVRILDCCMLEWVSGESMYLFIDFP
jgi:hypothetical protein